MKKLITEGFFSTITYTKYSTRHIHVVLLGFSGEINCRFEPNRLTNKTLILLNKLRTPEVYGRGTENRTNDKIRDNNINTREELNERGEDKII